MGPELALIWLQASAYARSDTHRRPGPPSSRGQTGVLLSNGDNLWGGSRDGEEGDTGSSDWVYTAAFRRGMGTKDCR